MYRGTTPTYTFTLPDTVDLTEATNIYVSFAKFSGEEIYRKTGGDLEVSEHNVDLYMTQTETLALPDEVKIQLNWTYQEGTRAKRACSEIFSITTKKNLINEEIQ